MIEHCRFAMGIFEDNVSCCHPQIAKSVPLKSCDLCRFKTTGNSPLLLNTYGFASEINNSDELETLTKKKPCPCLEENKIPVDGLQFVWPYWAGGAMGDELRWSIRSVEIMFQGKMKVTLIGDKPDWYNGHIIRKKRVPSNMPNRAFRDMLSKVFFMATHPEIDKNFVWMMDDIYFIKPVTVNQISMSRAVKWRPSMSNSWQHRKTDTMRMLESLGRTQHDFATHLPHYVDKNKLLAIFEEFDLHKNTLLWEVLYGNTYREPPRSIKPFFARFKNHGSAESYKLLTKDATVLNHTSSTWCDGMREFLMDLLPSPSSVEKGGVSKPNFTIIKQSSRTVKRRPLETHRDYVEGQGQ